MYNILQLCCEGFEQKLEQQFLKPNRHRKKVYICSPYSDSDPVVQLDNMRRARLYMLYANEHMGAFGPGTPCVPSNAGLR